MRNRLKEAALLFFGSLGVALVIIKALKLVGVNAPWLYVPFAILGIVLTILEVQKTSNHKI